MVANALQTIANLTVRGWNVWGKKSTTHLILVLGLWALVMALTSCGKQDQQTFSMTLPAQVDLIQGETIAVAVTLDRSGGYGNPVEVTVDGLPEFVTAEPLTIARGELTGDLMLSAEVHAVQQGPVTISVTGRGSIETIVDTGLLLRGPAGTLDLTFGNAGRTLYDFGAESDLIRDIALQADGMIVAVGRGTNANNAFFAIARYTADGSLDTAFGTGGVTTTDFNFGFDQANAVTLGPNGEIIVAGQAQNGGAGPDIAVARYDSAGVLDTTFGGGGGTVLTDNGNNTEDFANSVALQADGSLLVAGQSFLPATGFDIAVARYDSVGSLDPSFGTSGMQFHDTATLFDTSTSMQLQADGNIVIAGSTETVASGIDMAVLRLMGTDGSLDTTFATTGALSTPFSNADDFNNASVVQPDGKIVTVGRSANEDVVLARFNADGTPDTTFGTGTGISAYDLTGAYDNPNAVALQIDGKIVVAGESRFGTNEDFTVSRYDADGTLDPSFNGGMATTDFANGFDQIFALIIQPDGRILVAGRAFNGTNEDFAMARFWQ